MKKRFVLGVLVLVVFAGVVTAEEITGTILFEPRDSIYSISTGENSRVADKRLSIAYSFIGEMNRVLPDYLVRGAKIVYENGGLPEYRFEPMRNTMGEVIHPGRLIAIIMEDGYYMELTEIMSDYFIASYFPFLVAKLKREGRW